MTEGFKKISHFRIHRLFPPSRAHVSWRFDQIWARLDQMEGQFVETRILPKLHRVGQF
jgi:hypothetical protein